MRKTFFWLVFLAVISILPCSLRAMADDLSSENQPVTPTFEAAPLITPETNLLVTGETTSATSSELVSATTEATTLETTTKPPEEGSTYKGLPWGADFPTFQTIKSYNGSLSPFSAGFISSADDNDIALLLGVPVSDKDPNGSQRVMFEYVPHKFASVYFEPDDTHYVFYDGKFALTFSRINEQNFELYRDTFYKKYEKTGSFSKRYALGAQKTYLLQAAIFKKGKTDAFLIKSQYTSGKKSTASAKLVFASTDLLAAIRQEINNNLAASRVPSLEQDLNKIE